MVLGFHMLFAARVCICVFVSPVREIQGKQVDPQEGHQALRDIIPCFLNCFHLDWSIADEECDNGLPNSSTVTPDLVLGANDSENHPQCKQHHQKDRRDIEKDLATRMER
jgi:hypothetical protein